MQLTPTDKFHAKFRKPREGRTLIVGSRVYPTREDRRKAYESAVGVDMQEGDGVDFVADLENWTETRRYLRPGSFAHIECRSVLEHSRRPWLMAATIERLLMQGGTLDVSAPFVWRVHARPNDYFRYTTEAIRELFPGIEWRVLRYVTERKIEKPDAPTQGVVHEGQTFFARSEVLGHGTKK